jgi:hypothetical protein
MDGLAYPNGVLPCPAQIMIFNPQSFTLSILIRYPANFYSAKTLFL